MRYLLFLIVTFYAHASYAQLIELAMPCDEGVVSADYQSGVDVNGNAVVSADIDGGVTPLLYPIRIPIELDVIKSLGIDVPVGINMDEASLAFVEMSEDGRVRYNGKDISNHIATECDDGTRFVPSNITGVAPLQKPSDKPEKTTGHKAPDSVASDATIDGDIISGQYP